MAIRKQYTLIGGPGKFDMMLALFQGTRVTFTIKEIKEFNPKASGLCHVRVVSIARHQPYYPDGWLIEGYFEGGYYDYFYHNYGLRFKAVYKSRFRRGHLKTREPIVSSEPFSTSSKAVPK